MARASNNTSFLFLAICVGLFLTISSAEEETISTSVTFDVPAPGPHSYQYTFPPEPAFDPVAFNCASKISFDCSLEITGNEFSSSHVEKKCCKQLLNMGKECHDLLAKRLLKEFDNKDKADGFLARSDNIWNYCARLNGGQ